MKSGDPSPFSTGDGHGFRQRLAALGGFCVPVSAGLGYLLGGWELAAASAGTCALIFVVLLLTIRRPDIDLKSKRRSFILVVSAFLILGAVGVAALLVAGQSALAAALIVALGIVAVTSAIGFLASERNSATR